MVTAWSPFHWPQKGLKMFGIPLGLLYANAGEWAIHKYVLHGLGKKKTSFWAFHWHEHHGASRRSGFADPNYEKPTFGWHAQGKEAFGLVGLAALHLPLLPVAPFFTGAVLYSIARYHRVHKRSHLEPEWAREHLSWHYDHHMGPDQDANWCVSKPWFDIIMKTRKPYAFTEREERDIARRLDRAERKRARAERDAVQKKLREAEAAAEKLEDMISARRQQQEQHCAEAKQDDALTSSGVRSLDDDVIERAFDEALDRALDRVIEAPEEAQVA